MRQRAVDQNPNVVRAGVGKDAFLDVATEQVVWRLKSLDRRGRAELLHLRRVEVGDADVANLAGRLQLGQYARRFREGNLRVGPVDLVDIDVVHAQRLEAGVDTASNPVRACVTLDAPAGGGPETALGGDHHLVSGPILQRLGQQALGRAETISLRGVEKVDPPFRGAADGRDRGLLVCRAPVAAALPGAVGDSRNL